MHQPELVEMLGRLHEEYEAAAARIESGIKVATRGKAGAAAE
jgi:hypothetical protein